MYRFTPVLLFSAIAVVTDGQIQLSTTCAAPQESPGRTSTIYDINDQLVKGVRVPKGGYVQLQCADGYFFSDGSNTSVSNCRPTSTAEWHPAIRPCQRICRLPKTSNVDLTCKFNDLEINCNNTPLFSGTEIRPRCKELHHLSQDFIPDYTTIRCLDDGTWNKRLFKCDPDCGLPKQDLLIENGSNATLGQFPWHVAIYYVPRQYRLICGGTLIAPNIVLSAAHCFYNESFSYPLTTPADFAIVVGKLTRNYTIIDDVAQERLPISKILFNEKPYDPRNGRVADIVLIILEQPVTISTHVLPVCFRAYERLGFRPGKDAKGILCGWGLDETNRTAGTLKTVQLPFIHYNQCSGKLPGLTQDKFCAGADRGPRARSGDSGGGLVFKDPRTNFYYIRGIVSTAERFSESSITSFTDVSYYQDWIDSVMQEIKSGNKTDDVPLPTSTENVIATTLTTKRPTSSAGAKPVCPPLQPSNVDLACKYRRREINCNGSLMSGVEVTPTCKPVHYISPDFDPDYTTIRCQDDGRWENTLFRCIPDCGVPPQQTLVAFGEEGKLGQLPWLVAIYKVDQRQAHHILICAGTLLTPNVVLTAAHCFYDEGQRISMTKNVQNYFVMVGKITRNDKTIDNEFQKKIEIAEIVLSDRPYNPSIGRGSDIAMIILKQNITLSPYVHPACFRKYTHSGFNPGNGLKGILGGWGFDEANKATETLKTVQMPYINFEDCIKMNISSLALDQFCAGTGLEGTAGPRKGDSGAGLVFKDPYSNKYHLRGLLSGSEKYGSAHFKFTDISFYEEWIDRIIQQKSGQTNTTVAKNK